MKGHLEKRYKSSWTIVIDLGRDPVTGKQKRIYRSVKCNKKQAEQEMQRLMAELQQGTYVAPERITLAEYLRKWLETACVPRLAERTVQGYRTNIDKHIIPNLGQLLLSDLQPLHLQSLYSNLLAQGLSARTVELVHVTIHAALKQAVKWQLVSRNAADAVEPPRPRRSELRVLTPDEADRLIREASGTSIGDLVLMALHTGMRRGELLALRWEDIDFERGTVHVERAMVKVKGKVIVKPPKTEHSRRTIPLDEEVLAMLKSLRQRNPHDLVFCRQDGSPLDPSTVTHQFATVAKRAGFPGLRFHDQRHTYATIALTAGVPMKVVQELLGHQALSTTADIYTHVTDRLRQEAARSIGYAYKQGKEKNERRFSDGRHLSLVK